MRFRMNIAADSIDSIPLLEPPRGYLLRRIRKSDVEKLPNLLSSIGV